MKDQVLPIIPHNGDRVEQLGEQIQTLEAEKEALRGETAAKQQVCDRMCTACMQTQIDALDDPLT